MKPYRNRVSGSRLPALFDCHRFTTRRMLWEYIANNITLDEGDSGAIYAGQFLEEGIMRWAGWVLSAEQEKPVQVEPTPQGRSSIVVHKTLRASCITDGLVRCPTRGLGIISVKNVDSMVWLQRWKVHKNGVPPDVEMQLQTEMSVLRSHGEDIQWGVIAACVGGRDLHLFDRKVLPEWEATMEEALNVFFDSIANDDPPPMDYFPEEYELVKRLWPTNDPIQICKLEEDNAKQEYAHDLIIDLLNASEKRKDAEKSEKSLKAELADMAGKAGLILVPGASLRITSSEKSDTKVPCPKCGTDIVTRKGSTSKRFTPKEL